MRIPTPQSYVYDRQSLQNSALQQIALLEVMTVYAAWSPVRFARYVRQLGLIMLCSWFSKDGLVLIVLIA